jgi:predicted dehydrogenase
MSQETVRYAVVGLGYFSQAAVLPGFAQAKNSELVAIVSDDPRKRKELSKTYEVPTTLGYAELDAFLATGAVDAVYIVLPNALHAEYALRAARAGVHVLCEKPMAVTEAECQQMIDACESSRVKLMVGYRLHFEPANLDAVATVRSGKLGDVRMFSSVFTMQVREGNSRVRADLGGGPLRDIGVYCINAARYLFGEEPIEAMAFSATNPADPRFVEVEEQYAAALRFPSNRLASFVVGFGAADNGRYELLGTKGTLRVDPAYHHAGSLRHELIIGGKITRRTYDSRDQVASEIIHFSDCILNDRTPEPSGEEGLADVRVIQALETSARIGRAVAIEPIIRRARPGVQQRMRVAPHGMPRLVEAESPTR